MLEELAALLDDELELDAPELEEPEGFSEDFSVDFGLSAGLSDGFSEDFSGDFSDEDVEDSLLPEPLMVLLAASRLSLR